MWKSENTMQELLWLDHLPSGTLEGGLERVNGLYWNISVQQGGEKWCVWSGEAPIFCADSQEAIHAFLYGLSLAYSILPEPVFQNMREELKLWVE